MNELVTGLFTGLGLIVAIGAQNALVLRQGLARRHLGPVVGVCAVSDVTLIVLGTSGIAVFIGHAPSGLTLVRWAGVIFLLVYAAITARRAVRPSSLMSERDAVQSRRRVVAQAIALTWLNPHVYLDAMLLGSIASSHGQAGRWWFAVGAASGSVVWFLALGYGARRLAPLLVKPGAWRIIDTLIALTMVLIAAKLAQGL